MSEHTATTPDYRPDFFDRSVTEAGTTLLRCRSCGQVIDHIPRDWLDARGGDVVPCPNCKLGQRIPTAEEAEWPDRKDPADPVAGVPAVDREQHENRPARG